jgi:hypothetical protein
LKSCTRRHATPPHLTCELIFADPDCICHVACTETIPKRYGTPIQDHMLRYSEVFRTVMLPPGVACTELKIVRAGLHADAAARDGGAS